MRYTHIYPIHWQQPLALTHDQFSLLAQVSGLLTSIILEITRYKVVEIAISSSEAHGKGEFFFLSSQNEIPKWKKNF